MKRRSIRSRRLSTRRIFFACLVLALLAIWLPQRWTRPLGNITQLIAPVQDALFRGGQSVAGQLEAPGGVRQEEYEAVRASGEALRNQVVALSARVSQLEEINRELTGLRQAGFPREGRLIPARVLRGDAVAWRDAVLLDRGGSSAAKPNDWVVSRKFVNVGAEQGVTDGMAVLASETLVGRVLHTAPYTATVLLLSDPSMRLEKVRVGRVNNGQLSLLEADFLLCGVGRGRMVIEDVDRRYVDPPRIREGDLVVSPPDDPRLPFSLVIGRIVGIEPHENSPLLLSRLRVEPIVAPTELTSVYVVDCVPGARKSGQ